MRKYKKREEKRNDDAKHREWWKIRTKV